MAKEDLLGRGEFIEMLKNIIMGKVQGNSGCSLAIDGTWGCGKSFILKKLEADLRGLGYFVVHYNCWQNDYYEEPLVAVLSVLVDSLNSIKVSESNQDEEKRRTKELAISFFKNLAFMIVKNKLGVDFEKIGVSIEDLKSNAKDALDKDKAELFDKNFDPHLLLKQSIETIRDFLFKIKQEWRAVVIVVDELDRCTPEYSIKVLERLHHICYDAENDSFQFIQIAAINRDELCDGISKAYGRAFIANAYSGVHSTNSYFNKKGSKSFGNYYLQKFIQMIIPVPQGRPQNITQALLNGFESNFSDQGNECQNLLMDLFEWPFSEVPMRIKEEMIELVRLTHQITVEREFAGRANCIKPSLVVLCVEVLDVFCLAIMRTGLPKIQQEQTHNDAVEDLLHRRPNSGVISLKIKCRDEFVYNSELFAKCIFGLFKVKIKPLDDKNDKPDFAPRIQIPEIGLSNIKNEKITFKLDNPKAEVVWYYLGENDKFQLEEGSTPNEVDVKFVEAFRSTLDILT